MPELDCNALSIGQNQAEVQLLGKSDYLRESRLFDGYKTHELLEPFFQPGPSGAKHLKRNTVVYKVLMNMPE